MKYIDSHTHNKTIESQVVSLINYEICDDIPHVGYASVGLHPWDIEPEMVQNSMVNIEKQLKQKNVIALGEFGLDKLRGSSFSQQMIVFNAHLELAKCYKKPIILHCVKSYSEILALRKITPIAESWVLHGFRGNLVLAHQLIDKEIALSFGMALLYSVSLQNVFKALPLEYVLLETDDADVSIIALYEYAAQLKQISVLELQVQITHNFKEIFHVEFE